ncbi:MAG TPA: endo-1,4-beta-xylanase [Nostocaceae cyanobacterium]|nr:endo-1,4-beta-xylanase [Nostocaceae cyanobacterium]
MRSVRLLSRKNAIYLGLGALTGIAALGVGSRIREYTQIQALDDPTRDFTVVGTATLKQRAAQKGLIYGADCGTLNLQSDPALASLLVKECAMLVAGFLKWDQLRPTADTFNFTRGDWYADFAIKNGMLLRGHTLVWHESLPRWFKETVNSQNSQQFLQQHIQQVVGHYAGKMHSWDVVNEVISIDDGLPNNLRQTPWLEFLGPDYIDLAFRMAAEVDPKALLVYNDYGLEYDTPRNEAKRNAVLKLLESLKSKGTPIHAFGMQSHLVGHETQFNPEKLSNFFQNIANLGLKILITEMDVIENKLPADLAKRDRIVAGAYEDYLSVALQEKAVIAVITWGLSDRYTWLSEFYPRSDGAAVRPLPFDQNFRPKLAWNGIARAFDLAPTR